MGPNAMHLAINAYFWDRPDTGSGQYIRQLAAHLTGLATDLRITLVAPRPAGTADHRLPASCTWHPAPGRPGHLGKVLFEQSAFPRACREVGADLALVPYWGSPLRSPVPLVVTIHDLIPLLLREYRGGPLGRLYTGLVAAAARGAQQVITDSHASRDDILTHLRLPAERVWAIHLAAGDHFRPGPPDPAVAAKYGLPDQYTLYLGGFDLRKNLETLLHAYRYVGPAIGDEFPLVLAGRPVRSGSPRFPDLEALIRELDLGEYVHITGYIDEADKPAVYRGAAALVQLSHYEGFGLTPLEAMSCGTPVVASDRSSLPEVVGAAGFTLDPADVEGIAGAIIACAIQDDLKADLRRRGLEQAARFSWRRTAEETLQVLRRPAG
jgi:glycosyltransferase involved in cell wall biosynthesis